METGKDLVNTHPLVISLKKSGIFITGKWLQQIYHGKRTLYPAFVMFMDETEREKYVAKKGHLIPSGIYSKGILNIYTEEGNLALPMINSETTRLPKLFSRPVFTIDNVSFNVSTGEFCPNPFYSEKLFKEGLEHLRMKHLKLAVPPGVSREFYDTLFCRRPDIIIQYIILIAEGYTPQKEEYETIIRLISENLDKYFLISLGRKEISVDYTLRVYITYILSCWFMTMPKHLLKIMKQWKLIRTLSDEQIDSHVDKIFEIEKIMLEIKPEGTNQMTRFSMIILSLSLSTLKDKTIKYYYKFITTNHLRFCGPLFQQGRTVFNFVSDILNDKDLLKTYNKYYLRLTGEGSPLESKLIPRFIPHPSQLLAIVGLYALIKELDKDSILFIYGEINRIYREKIV